MRKSRGNPLAEYRRVQRQMRAIFDPFTAKACPTCTTPCCVKPTKVTPVDVALAVHTGHVFAHLQGRDPFAPALEDAVHRIESQAVPLPMLQEKAPRQMCEFLHQGRCSFPNDLRPFGCTTYLCPPMYAGLPEEAIRRLRRLSRALEHAHRAVLRVMGQPD